MTMTKEEIVAEYKQSKNKRNQIQILADLNTCSKDDILTILKESGQVKQQELPRYSNVKAEKTIAPGETKEGELNDLEKSMSEIITELRGENDNLKGTIQELNDKIGGYETREQNLKMNSLTQRAPSNRPRVSLTAKSPMHELPPNTARKWSPD